MDRELARFPRFRTYYDEELRSRLRRRRGTESPQSDLKHSIVCQQYRDCGCLQHIDLGNPFGNPVGWSKRPFE
jgi:hypothetical protein